MRPAVAALLFAIAFAACSKDSPTQVKIIPPADTIGTWKPDTVYLSSPPTKFTTTLAGRWCDRPMTPGYSPSLPPKFFFCADSAANYFTGQIPGYYVRCDSSDVRVLDDGRIWLSAGRYTGIFQGVNVIRFCGTIRGDSLIGTALMTSYFQGDVSGTKSYPWKFVRVQ